MKGSRRHPTEQWTLNQCNEKEWKTFQMIYDRKQKKKKIKSKISSQDIFAIYGQNVSFRLKGCRLHCKRAKRVNFHIHVFWFFYFRKDEGGKDKCKTPNPKVKAVEEYVKGLMSREKETGIEKEYATKVRGKALHLDNQLKPKQVIQFTLLNFFPKFSSEKFEKSSKGIKCEKETCDQSILYTSGPTKVTWAYN